MDGVGIVITKLMICWQFSSCTEALECLVYSDGGRILFRVTCRVLLFGWAYVGHLYLGYEGLTAFDMERCEICGTCGLGFRVWVINAMSLQNQQRPPVTGSATANPVICLSRSLPLHPTIAAKSDLGTCNQKCSWMCLVRVPARGL